MLNKLKKWTIESLGDQYKKILLYIVGYLLSIVGIQKLRDTLQMLVPLWIVMLIVLSILFCFAILSLLRSRQSSKPRYYKYCPECNLGINAKLPNVYCSCGTKYLEKCPECNKKIIRDRSRVCSFCGYNFPIKPRTGHEWMGR